MSQTDLIIAMARDDKTLRRKMQVTKEAQVDAVHGKNGVDTAVDKG